MKNQKTNMKKGTSKIAHRDIVVGTFERLIIPKGKYALVCHTDRGVIVDHDRVGRRAFFLKWATRLVQEREDVWSIRSSSRRTILKRFLNSTIIFFFILAGQTTNTVPSLGMNF